VCPEAEHGEHGLAGRAFDFRQRLPGPRQQLVAPARQEFLVQVRARSGLGWRFGEVVGQRLRLPAPAGGRIRDNVGQHPPEDLAETATLRAGPTQVAVQEAVSELLEQFVGRVSVTQCSLQVAPDRAAVAFEETALGSPHVLGRVAVGLAHQRPLRGDQAQALRQGFGVHGLCSWGWGLLKNNARRASACAILAPAKLPYWGERAPSIELYGLWSRAGHRDRSAGCSPKKTSTHCHTRRGRQKKRVKGQESSETNTRLDG